LVGWVEVAAVFGSGCFAGLFVKAKAKVEAEVWSLVEINAQIRSVLSLT